ncbi:MAG: hypothetical protein QOE32_652, partial [Pseudonocardiales bacterium]|nr:hypothetical protein [Pseudonocardiales bacterium]
RHYAKYHKIKRPQHRGCRYQNPPKIHIYNLKVLT